MSIQGRLLNPREGEGCRKCGGKLDYYYDNLNNYLERCLEVNCRYLLNMVNGLPEVRTMPAKEFCSLIEDVIEWEEEE